MKKVLSIAIMLLSALTTSAQEIDRDSLIEEVIKTGVYEVKEVVMAENADKNMLYARAMEALSDWTGNDGRSRAGLDYTDKEAGTVIYKGQCYQGYYKTSLGGIINSYINFTLKVRCKDGRAQVTVTAPSVTVEADKIAPRTVAMRDIIINQQSGKSPNERQKKRVHMTPVSVCVQQIVDAMKVRLATAPDDDDF